MNMLRILAPLLFVLSALSEDGPDYSQVELKAHKVNGSVYMIAGTDDANHFSGGNIAVSVGEDGILMIDAKMAPLADKIMAVLAKLTGKELEKSYPKFVLNTHVHGDHVHGNSAFQDHGHVISHENVRSRLEKTQPEDQWPTVTFNDRMTFFFNGETIAASHYSKGHTDGDVMVSFREAKVLHMGDHFFSGLFPYVDLKNGGSVEGYIQNVKNVLDWIDESIQIIPGHGPLSTKKDLQEFHAMLTGTRDLILADMKAGLSLEELKAKGLPESYAKWSWNFITTPIWIETVFKSYSK